MSRAKRARVSLALAPEQGREHEQEPEQHDVGDAGKRARSLTLWFDGASKGNPGPAGSGWVVVARDGLRDSLVAAGWRFIGRDQTNNVAEYSAAVHGLGLVLERFSGVVRVDVKGDSMLVVNHMNGEWACRSLRLEPLKKELSQLVARAKADNVEVRFSHVPRFLNRLADELANVAVQRESCVDVVVSEGERFEASLPSIRRLVDDVVRGSCG